MVALGYVPDLRPVLAAADVAVNPVATGSGSNVKLSEYLAAGLPVVTTPLGLRGYEDVAGLVTLADLEGFSAALQGHGEKGKTRPELTRYGWTTLGQRLYGIYAALVAGEDCRVP